MRPLCCRLSWNLQRLFFPKVSPCGEGFPETFVDFPGRYRKWQDLRGHLCGFSSANGRRKWEGKCRTSSLVSEAALTSRVLITRRSLVQIRPPQPIKSDTRRVSDFFICRILNYICVLGLWVRRANTRRGRFRALAVRDEARKKEWQRSEFSHGSERKFRAPQQGVGSLVFRNHKKSLTISMIARLFLCIHWVCSIRV